MKIVLLEPIGSSENKVKDFEAKLKDLGHELISFDSKPSSDEEIIERIWIWR